MLPIGLSLDWVRWVSGLNQQFAKLPYGFPYRGFESPFHRTGLQLAALRQAVVVFMPRQACLSGSIKQQASPDGEKLQSCARARPARALGMSEQSDEIPLGPAGRGNAQPAGRAQSPGCSRTKNSFLSACGRGCNPVQGPARRGHWGCRSRATKSPWSQSESMQAVYDHYAYTESVVFQPINILHILEYRFVSDIFALQDFTPVCVLYHHQPEESLLLHASLHRISL